MKNVDVNDIEVQMIDERSRAMRTVIPIVDRLQTTSYLIKAVDMACGSLEDLDQRNAFAALLAQIEENISKIIDDVSALDVAV